MHYRCNKIEISSIKLTFVFMQSLLMILLSSFVKYIMLKNLGNLENIYIQMEKKSIVLDINWIVSFHGLMMTGLLDHWLAV